jgi:hypothetical protein
MTLLGELGHLTCVKMLHSADETWVEWLRMQGHCLPATLEATGSNPGPGKINLNKN